VGPRNPVLDGVQIPHGKGQFWGKGWHIVKYRDYRLCVAVMRPFVKLLWPLICTAYHRVSVYFTMGGVHGQSPGGVVPEPEVSLSTLK